MFVNQNYGVHEISVAVVSLDTTILNSLQSTLLRLLEDNVLEILGFVLTPLDA